MSLRNQQDTFNSIAAAIPINRIHGAIKDLHDFAGEMNYAHTQEMNASERDNLDNCHLRIARYGLEISQKAIPLLQQLAARSLEVAGKQAIRRACKPLIIDLGGGEIRERKSEYTLPPEYAESVTEKVANKVLGK